jgi:hypothetical protein
MACRGACDLFRWVSASAMGYCAASRSDCGANPVLTSPKRTTFRDQAILAHVASGMRAYRHKGCMHQRRRGGAADLEVTVTRGGTRIQVILDSLTAREQAASGVGLRLYIRAGRASERAYGL